MNNNILVFYMSVISIASAQSLFASNDEKEGYERSSSYYAFSQERICAEILKTSKLDKPVEAKPSEQVTVNSQTIIKGDVHIHLHNPVFHISCNGIKDLIFNRDGNITSNRNGSVTRNEN